MTRKTGICLTVLLLLSFTASAEVIKKISIEGNKNIKEEMVTLKMESKINEEFSDANVAKDIKAIFELDLFSDVEISRAQVDGGVELVVKVKERPLIKDIKYNGAKNISQSDLESDSGFKAGVFYSEVKIKAALEKMAVYYRERGYYLAKMTYEFKENLTDNTAEVTFNINEGKEIVVGDINIKGLKAFAADVIRGKMETTKPAFLVSGFFKEDVFGRDKEKIIKFYNEEGYINAAITSSEVKLNDAKDKIIIDITIDEGEQYKIGEVQVEVDDEKIIPKDKIREILTFKKDDIFNQENYRRDLERIKFAYSEKGYIAVTILDDKSFDKEKKTVSFSIRVKEGKVFYVEKIVIDGNYKTQEYVIARELRVKVGEPFDGDKFRTSLERIYNLGFFEDVTYEILAGSSDEKKALVFNVKERPTGQLQVGGTYSTLDGLTGYLQVTENNLFGTGQRLSAMWEFGSLKQNYELSFLEPYFLNQPVSVGSSIYKLLRTYGTDYKDERIGGNIKAGFSDGDYTKYWLSYQYEQIHIYDIASTVSDYIKNSEGTSSTSSMTFTWTEDTRDSIFFNTKKGHRYSASVELAGGLFLGDNNYTKYLLDAGWYQKTFMDFVLAFHVGAGYATGFGSTPSVPFYERFFVGGTDTVRGYDERALSPRDSLNPTVSVGGNFMLFGNLEYRFPIAGPLMGTFFYDFGKAYTYPEDLRLDNLSSGVGFGLRFVITGAMMVRLDYGVGLDPAYAVPGGRVHFNIGNIF